MKRRDLLKAAGWLTLGYPLQRFGAVQTLPRFSTDPFVAGVASGDPTRNGIVLWTRLMPDPKEVREWQRQAVFVDWQIASDEKMARIVRNGRAVATPEYGHSVHVDVDGLDSNRWYWYRFRAGSAESVVGRTKTAPASATDRIRFAFASCQRYHEGFYTAYEHMVHEDIDAVVFLGDYVYENVGGRGEREVTGEEPKTLEGYRDRYALYRSDAHLREAHRLFPWIITWDDHDVQDNYAADIPRDSQSHEEFLRRRAAAYHAHYEWLPMPRASLPNGPNSRIYRALSFGPLANFMVLDGRQYRSDQPCGDGANKEPCAEFLNDRTMLGPAQERWLESEMRSSKSQWNILANQVSMTVIDSASGPPERYSMDSWSGYEMARRRITAAIQNTRVQNPVVITGDFHSNWVGDLKVDYKNSGAPVVGTEFIGTSISSGGDGADRGANTDAVLAENPQCRFYNNQRGYVRCEANRQSFTADFRVLERVSVPGSPISTRASFVVENGQPGAHKV